jgi:hypothetical protein
LERTLSTSGQLSSKYTLIADTIKANSGGIWNHSGCGSTMLDCPKGAAKRFNSPWAKGYIDERKLLKKLITLCLHKATANCNYAVWMPALESLGMIQCVIQLLIWLFPNGAGVKDYDRGKLTIISLNVSQRFQQATNALGIVRIHLTAKCSDVVGLH